ncbi:P-selectin glycoprotein ligand 1 [Sciurus carolinensis]|uniref:P-selectin glycoprotein ligand 1 n=1 Tax=Sciurus carolinensis TaxID=30640 RepID=UPI001FB31C31|nr:P-selectin glycoprotein ligand 1 [Sciurus carolinensis]
MTFPLLEASIRDFGAASPSSLATALEAHSTGIMPRHLLLLLMLLEAGCILQLQEKADAAAPAPRPARGRRQVTLEDYEDEDYPLEATDPPETLDNHTGSVAADPQLLTTVGTSEQRASAGPGTPEPATGPSAGLGAGGTVGEEPSTETATLRVPGTELTSATAPITGAPTTLGALPGEAVGAEDLSTGPAVTQAETTPPGATGAETSPPAATQAETSPPATTEAETSPPSATDAETSPPSATDAETSPPATSEAETSPPATTEAVFVKAVVVEAESTEPLAVKPRSTEAPAAPVTYQGAIATTRLAESTLQSREAGPPGSPTAPSPAGASGLIPVKQCLLAILVLALVATVFLVCTVVLAVRLSRKGHMYPVRNYSPTEMVCISALLPDAGEGAPTAANGGLPKSRGLKAEAAEDREGDDLTLHSFLP